MPYRETPRQRQARIDREREQAGRNPWAGVVAVIILAIAATLFVVYVKHGG